MGIDGSPGPAKWHVCAVFAPVHRHFDQSRATWHNKHNTMEIEMCPCMFVFLSDEWPRDGDMRTFDGRTNTCQEEAHDLDKRKACLVFRKLRKQQLVCTRHRWPRRPIAWPDCEPFAGKSLWVFDGKHALRLHPPHPGTSSFHRSLWLRIAPETRLDSSECLSWALLYIQEHTNKY